MTISYSKFMSPTVLGTSVSTLFSVPAQPAATLLRGARMRLVNTSVATVSVTLHAVPLASSASDGNAFCKNKTIAAGNYLDIDMPIIGAGGTVQALSDTASAVTAHMLNGSLFSS
jgi:hypothetical protein